MPVCVGGLGGGEKDYLDAAQHARAHQIVQLLENSRIGQVFHRELIGQLVFQRLVAHQTAPSREGSLKTHTHTLSLSLSLTLSLSRSLSTIKKVD